MQMSLSQGFPNDDDVSTSLEPRTVRKATPVNETLKECSVDSSAEPDVKRRRLSGDADDAVANGGGC